MVGTTDPTGESCCCSSSLWPARRKLSSFIDLDATAWINASSERWQPVYDLSEEKPEAFKRNRTFFFFVKSSWHILGEIINWTHFFSDLQWDHKYSSSWSNFWGFLSCNSCLIDSFRSLKSSPGRMSKGITTIECFPFFLSCFDVCYKT